METFYIPMLHRVSDKINGWVSHNHALLHTSYPFVLYTAHVLASQLLTQSAHQQNMLDLSIQKTMPSYASRQPPFQTLHHKLPPSLTTRRSTFSFSIKVLLLRTGTFLWRVFPQDLALLSLPITAMHAVVIRRVFDAFKHASKTLMTFAFFLFLGLGRYMIVCVILCFTC